MIPVLENMYHKAASGIDLQRASKYIDNPRATQLHKVNHEQGKMMPTDNLCTEQYLARFVILASAAKSHKFLKALHIRDDVMLCGNQLSAR